MTKSMMRDMMPAVLVAAFVAIVIPRIGALAPVFAAIALIGWTSLALWVLHRARALPGPVLALMDRAAPAKRIENFKAEQREVERQRLAAGATADNLKAALDEALIGQTLITGDVARAVEVYVGKKNSTRPLSIALAGPPGSGRTTFAEGLSAALAPLKAGRLFRVDCASDAEVDFGDIATRLGGLQLPILLLDNIDRIGDQRHSGRIISDVLRLLDTGAASSGPGIHRAIVILTSGIDEGRAKELFRKETSAAERSLAQRQAVRGTGRMPPELVDRVDVVGVLKPLDELEQIAVVWKTFCVMALSEHEITIVDDRLGMGDGIEDFLLAARARWVDAGVSGVREAARFVGMAADQAFMAATRAGHSRVRARWDAAAEQIRLDPVSAEDPQSASIPSGEPALSPSPAVTDADFQHRPLSEDLTAKQQRPIGESAGPRRSVTP